MISNTYAEARQSVSRLCPAVPRRDTRPNQRRSSYTKVGASSPLGLLHLQCSGRTVRSLSFSGNTGDARPPS
jgi:hypothetical protein